MNCFAPVPVDTERLAFAPQALGSVLMTTQDWSGSPRSSADWPTWIPNAGCAVFPRRGWHARRRRAAVHCRVDRAPSRWFRLGPAACPLLSFIDTVPARASAD
jgi:hypothetical protein